MQKYIFVCKKTGERPVKTGLNRSLLGLQNFESAIDHRPDRGYGPDRSYQFAVLIGQGPGPVTVFFRSRNQTIRVDHRR